MDFINEVTCDHRVGNPTVSYILSTCPRCLGKGTYGGVVFDPFGAVQTVSGSKLLAQQIKKIMTENIRESGYGFDYGLLTGVVDPTKLSAIRSEIVRVLSYLRFVQQREKARGFSYLPSEELAGIQNVTVGNSPTDPRAVNVSVTVFSVSGTLSNTTVVLRR